MIVLRENLSSDYSHFLLQAIGRLNRAVTSFTDIPGLAFREGKVVSGTVLIVKHLRILRFCLAISAVP